jgi:hypothetical protein
MLAVKLVAGCLALAVLAPAAALQSTAPVWTRPDRFWYRRAVAGGNVWMTVDAAHAPVTSPDGRWEAVVVDHNVAIRAAGRPGTPTALSADGKAGYAYQPGSIRWSPDSASVSAYRVSEAVWLSESVAVTSVKNLVTQGQWPTRSGSRR